jgi:L-iditol 2-dehydrogenase
LLDDSSSLSGAAYLQLYARHLFDIFAARAGGYGADVVVEAIGLPVTWEQALKLAGKGGKILEFGGCPPGTEVKINAEQLHYDEHTVLGTFHTTPLHFRKALNLIASRTIDVRPLVTRKMKLEQIKDAFEVLSTSKTEIKIGIIP